MIKNSIKTTTMLSNRETQVLRMISEEYTNHEIASSLFVSTETIRTHRRHLLQKLAARNTAGLVRRAFECQILSIDRR